MARTCEAVSPVRTISSSTPEGWLVELAQERPFLVGEGQLGGMADGWLVGGGVDLADQGAELFEDVVDRLDESGAVADQAVAAAACEAVDRAGHGENFAVLHSPAIRRLLERVELSFTCRQAGTQTRSVLEGIRFVPLVGSRQTSASQPRRSELAMRTCCKRFSAGC